jgi:hypothetical protein
MLFNLTCWCINVRNHTLTIEPIVPVHWYPVTGAVREYNNFPYVQVYVIIHYATKPFGWRQLINHFVINQIYYLVTFNYWILITSLTLINI